MASIEKYLFYRYGADEAPEEEQDDLPDTGKLKLQEIKISFSAPPKNVQKTFDIKSKKEFEQNFQWVKYAVILSNEEKTKWYTYIFALEPWGTRQKAAPELFASDHKGNKLEGQPVDITPEEIDKAFSKLLSKPKLEPNLPESMVTYLNAPFTDPTTKKKIIDPKGKYTPTEFKNYFEDSKTETGTHFYVLITKSGEMKTPFGNKAPEGKTAPPSKGPEEAKPAEGTPGVNPPEALAPEEGAVTPEETKKESMESNRLLVKSALKKQKIGAIGGGFDIMEKLFYKQHKDQKKKKKTALDPVAPAAPAAPTSKVDPDALAKAIGLQGWDDVRNQRGGFESTMISPNKKLSAVPQMIGKVKSQLLNSVDFVNTYVSQKLVPDKQAFNTSGVRQPGSSGGDYYWESKNLDEATKLVTALLTVESLKIANSDCVVDIELKNNSFGPIRSVYLCGNPRRG